MKSADIVALAKRLRSSWNTNDPFEIAKKFGIEVLFRDIAIKGFTAQTVKIPGYPTIISINNAFNEKSKKILCPLLLISLTISYSIAVTSYGLSNCERFRPFDKLEFI